MEMSFRGAGYAGDATNGRRCVRLLAGRFDQPSQHHHAMGDIRGESMTRGCKIPMKHIDPFGLKVRFEMRIHPVYAKTEHFLLIIATGICWKKS